MIWLIIIIILGYLLPRELFYLSVLIIGFIYGCYKQDDEES